MFRSGLKKRKGRRMSLVVEGEDEGGITIKVTTLFSYHYHFSSHSHIEER